MSIKITSDRTLNCCSGTTTAPVIMDTVETALTNALVNGDLDVRSLPPIQRHSLIFDTYRRLQPGQSFVLVNDHDPRSLRYQFEAEHAGKVTRLTKNRVRKFGACGLVVRAIKLKPPGLSCRISGRGTELDSTSNGHPVTQAHIERTLGVCRKTCARRAFAGEAVR